ncbi:Nn.00g062930.m01.CDS01 [Neocucurbitaria sp. VM-36]
MDIRSASYLRAGVETSPSCPAPYVVEGSERHGTWCDRNQPCKTCVDRGLSLSCTYVRHTVAPQEPKVPNSVHDRIDQLEKLVTSLMGGKETEDGASALSNLSHLEQLGADNSEIPGTPDRVKISGDTTSYTNSGHWTSILDGITELREHLDQIPTSASARDESQEDVLGPDLLFGRQSHATKQELLAALPLRSEADQLINTYFASMDTAPSLMHRPTFLKEYDSFWSQPFEAPTMWLGLLYGILALGARFQATFEGHGPALQDDPATSLSSARMDYYREKAVQCLVLADYTKCPPYTVEAFLLYFGTEYLRSADTQFMMTRVRLAHAKVMDLMNATSQPPYREIMDLDAVLRDVYDKIPESTKAMPGEDFDSAISPTAMRRLFLGLSFLKAELMLHRPYLILGRTDLKYEYSRRVCLNAALEMLEFQRKLDSEIQPGGKLWSPGWQIGKLSKLQISLNTKFETFTVSWYTSSILAQDFLLATTVLILELDEDLIAPLQATPEIARSGLRLDRGPPNQTEIIDALRTANRIWVKASKRSNEARKVAAAVRLVLRKANVHDDHLTHRMDVNFPMEQHDLSSPSPSFDFNDLTTNLSSSGPFAVGDAIYHNPFGFEDIPMGLGPFEETINWSGMPTNFQMQPYGQFPQRPLFE